MTATVEAKTPRVKAQKSRAVRRVIVAGNWQICTGCGQWAKFKARHRLQQVIANVYTRGKWVRVEHWHPECYLTAGEPYGEAAGNAAKGQET